MGTACSKPGRGEEYTLQVKTGDRLGMGTDASVFTAFYNAQGLRTRDFKLDNLFRNDFESGHTDSIQILLEEVNFGDPVHIEIWRDGAGLGDTWFCEYIRMVHVKARKTHMFPVHRWIQCGSPVKLTEYDAVLPQYDEQVSQRRDELQRKRDMYVPVKNELTGMTTYKDLPPDENFSISSTFQLIQNGIKLLSKAALMDFTVEQWDSLKELEEIYREPHFPLPSVRCMPGNHVQSPSSAVYRESLASSVTGAQSWRSDKEFGNQRLTGCNPAQIRLCTKIPQNFAVNEEDLKPLLEGLTTEEAIDKKRLFIIDYEFVKDLPCFDGREICAPLALFFVNKDKYLMPIAIQIHQDPSPTNPVFYPTDPEYTWLMAKCYFNLADSSVHQSAKHLGSTHLMGEIIVIATHRSLAPSHPIFRLLAPHFLYLMAINNKAIADLMGEGGFADENMNIGHVGMAAIVKRSFEKWRLDVEGSLPADFQERGVLDPEVLPNYHYRDDALLLHKAISNFVGEVVEYYYDDPEKIVGDDELQEWARFLGGKPKDEGDITGGLKGFPNDGQFKTSTEITTVITDFIFLFSALHATVNFGQYDNFGFPPSYPAWLSGKSPQDKTALSEKDVITKLATKKQTLHTMGITALLSSRDTKSLGDFEIQYMHDPVGVKALEKFRTELKQIGRTIEERNKTREEKYIWLHPSVVPNSIAI